MFNLMRFSKILLATTALVAVGSLALRAQAQTLPTGGSVAAGQVSIGAPNAGRMTITQGSQNAIVNWQGFSIGQGGRVDIVQPNSSAAMLNRVTGQAPSTIAGQLNANGQVFLVNPNGIAITNSGVVNTGSFVASTLGISDGDFLAGRLRFQGNGASAAVSNAGRIQAAPGGYAALLGGRVDNSGTISVPLGRIGLGAGERVTLDLSGDGFLQVALPSAVGGDEALVSNSGRLSAPGGRVEMAAATAQAAARHAINMSGVVEANAVSGQAGSITFSGGPGGAVNVSGRVNASSAAGRGGNVTVTGANIALRGAQVDASGATGGGRVRIGGDRQGHGDLPRAQRVSVDNASVIRADATTRGNGGDIVLWSEGRTDFAGSISARGGAEGGRGGEAEVSSRGVLNYTGWTDLRAPQGAWGTLLLDPYNITISYDAPTTDDSFIPTTDNSVIDAGTLVTALDGANVTVSTGLAGSAGTQDGNITLEVQLDWSSAGILTLQAAGAIALNGAVTAAAGGLTLQAGGTISATDAISVARFELVSGNWVQNSATLPGFAATDFRITGGSFLRAAGGDGSAGTPYRLTDIYGLQGMGSSAALLGSAYQLAGDIAASGTSTWNGGAGFVPVGTDAARFTGSLDGTGYVINGLRINRAGTDQVGLIGVADTSSSISNLGLVGGAVTGDNRVGGLVGFNFGSITNAYTTGAVTGASRVGGLVGSNPGTVTGSHATGAVTGSGDITGGLVGISDGSITQSYATGTATGTFRVGGLVGSNPGSVTQSYATGAVTGSRLVGGLVGIGSGSITRSYATGAVTGTDTSDTRVGGLVGSNSSTSGAGSITQSYATGAVTGSSNVGGLVGFNGSGTIEQSYATGAVTGTHTTDTRVGGLVGSNGSTSGAGSIRQSYATGAVTGSGAYVGGLVGFNSSSSTITQSYWDRDTTRQNNAVGSGNVGGTIGLDTAQARIQTSYVGWDFGNSGVWYQAGDMRPILRSEAATADVNGVITIRNLNQLQLMGANLAGSYRLAGNIDASASNSTNAAGIWSSSGFVPVGTDGARFTGSLNGSGYVINGLRINRDGTDYVGLIGFAGTGSSISNLGLVGGAVTGSLAVGGLVGYNVNGTITKSYATGAVRGLLSVGGLVGYNVNGTITQSYATGAVTGDSDVGGLVGRNDGGTITQSYATGAVTGSYDRVGGLVGFNSGTITQSYATGAVTSIGNFVGGLAGWNSGAITQSYATGAVTSIGDVVGGLVGLNDSGTITLSYWDTQTTGQDNSAGGTGLSTSDARIQTSYVGWDFGSVWYQAGDMRPILRSEAATADVNGVITIRNLNQLQLMGANLAGSYRLAGNIDASATNVSANSPSPGIWGSGGFVPVGTNAARFTGRLDGAGYVINGLTINRLNTDYVGLIGYAETGSSISNLGLVGGAVTGRDYVGGLVGLNDGSITQAHATGAVSGRHDVGGLVGHNYSGSIAQAYAMGAVTGSGDKVGGLVGSNYGSITDAHATGEVRGDSTIGGLVGLNGGSITQAHATGAVTGIGNSVGGLVGFNSNYGSITDAHATGAVRGVSQIGGLVGLNDGSITQSYATTGAVSGGNYVGGLVGNNYYGDIKQSYATGAVSGDSVVGGLVGYNFSSGSIEQSYATGAVSGGNYVGGLVGYNSGSIEQTYASGAVSGSGSVGGLVGDNDSSSPIRQAYWDTESTGQTTSAGGIGLATAQMQDITSFRTTYAGWDFDNVWSPPNQVGQNNGSATAYHPQLYGLSPAVAVTTRLAASSRGYGDANPSGSFTYAGLRTGDSIATGALITGGPGASANVGFHYVSGSDAVVNNAGSGATYRMIYVPAALEVTPRLITVRANDLMRDGGRPNPPLTYTISSGSLVSGDAFTGGLLTEAGSLSQAGNYTISRGSLSLGPNYSITFLAGIMTVLPETQAVLPETQAVLPETLTVLPETLTVLPEKQTARLPMQMDPGNSASALVSQMDLTRQAELLQSADDVSKITPPNWGNGQ